MSMAKTPQWRKLPLSLAELCIDTTLRCGQSFRWRKVEDEWHCSLQGRVVSLRQDDTHLHYRATWPQKKSERSPAPPLMTPPSSVMVEDRADNAGDDDTEALLRHYFNLSLSLDDMYHQWSEADANFRRKAPKFTGVRIMNQDAWEALVAFICSSNNNIARISQMVQKLCDHYGGDPIATVAGHVFRDFPGPDALAGAGVEAHLRELGFGYRARYIAETARTVAKDRPAGWLLSLRNPASPAWGASGDAPSLQALVKAEESEEKKSEEGEGASPSYQSAHAALLELAGVGPKVADCACLMGLGWGEAVPLDTHMLTIAARDYRLDKRTGKSNSLSKGMYEAVGDFFRELWGPHAGWAQSVLFTANLRSFADRLADKPKAERTSTPVEVKVEEVTASTILMAKSGTPTATADYPTPPASGGRKKRKSVAEVTVDHASVVSVARRSKRRRT